MLVKLVENTAWSIERGSNCLNVYHSKRLMWSEQFTKEGNVWVVGKSLNNSALDRYLEPFLRELNNNFKKKDTKNFIKVLIDKNKTYDKIRVITNILYGIFLFEEAMEMSDEPNLYVLLGDKPNVLQTEPLKMRLRTKPSNAENYVVDYQEVVFEALSNGYSVLGYAYLPPYFKYELDVPTIVSLFEE